MALKSARRVAVLGAGIMGGSVALLLARQGLDVTLFDAAARPFDAASRWNEGKIHLGYLYSADPGLTTMTRLLPGGLQFRPLIEQMLGCSIAPAISAADDIYLCHRQSVVSPAAMAAYLRTAAAQVRAAADAARYLVDVSAAEPELLAPAQLAEIADPAEIVAGFRVPERSVATGWIADRFVAALAAEPRIALRMSTGIAAARPLRAGAPDGPWQIETASGGAETFDLVVNALWQGRLALDAGAGLLPRPPWSHRYRLALFLRSRRRLDLPSAIVAIGPFGDIKNYNGRDFYLSWYPDGLQIDSGELEPPLPPRLTAEQSAALAQRMFDNLARSIPGVRTLAADVESLEVRGGWVFAVGTGSIADPGSSLHRRSDFGIVRHGSYWSVDTGKYSTAPWLAHRLLARILHESQS